MSILKYSFIGLACVSLAILSQGCGDDPASSTFENSQYSSSEFVESSSDVAAYSSSSSSSVTLSNVEGSSSSKVVEPVETSSSSLIANSSSANISVSSSSIYSGSDTRSSSSSVTQRDIDRSSSSKVVEPVESSSSQVPSSSSAKPIKIDFYNGADISEVQEYERNNTKFYDVDGKESDIFTILKNHGFNSIRLRTFVSPKAKYGYAASGCGHDSEAYGDKDHVVAFAKKVKAAGMGLLVDMH